MELIVANSKSALKRIQIADRNRLHNKNYKSAVRTLIKKCFIAVSDYTENPTLESKQKVLDQMSKTYSKIDKAVKRGVLHINNGARKKSRLAKQLKQFVETATTE
ncbi:SSU ribosomal protein S20p [Richelia intracellularis HM01]|nr:SSU ribosomal protein S20p [Richelia intracellularis HM01]